MIRRLLWLGAILAALALAPPAARADEFATLVANLGGDSFAEKEKAIEALGSLDDPRAVPVLQALRDGNLVKTSDGRVLIVGTAGGRESVIDPETGSPLPDIAAAGLDRLRVNNRLRGRIEGVLGDLMLFSPN